MWYGQNFQWIHSIFPNGKCFSQFIDKSLKFYGSQSLVLSLKCDHTFLCEFPILFSTVRLKLGHHFSQFIHRFNIWILKCWFWAAFTSKFFPIHKREENLHFEKLRLDFQVFPNSLKSLKIEFSEMLRMVFQYDMWHQREASLWLIMLIL